MKKQYIGDLRTLFYKTLITSVLNQSRVINKENLYLVIYYVDNLKIGTMFGQCYEDKNL